MSLYVSEDILARILRLLPVKSLIRFRCVCKLMKQTIDSHNFMVDHLSLQKTQIIVQYGSGYNDREFHVIDPCKLPLLESLKDPTGSQWVILAGTLHGVVCLFLIDYGIKLWNPSTREILSCPLPEKLNYRRYLAYSGFWIDPAKKDFKVILHDFVFNNEAVLYNSTKEGWMKIPFGKGRLLFEGTKMGLKTALVIEGVAYWIRYVVKRIELKPFILSFDFGQETFNLIDVPLAKTFKHKLCKWQGKLSLMCCTQGPEKLDYKCNIYSRQDALWVNMFSFNLKSPNQIQEVLWVLGLGEAGTAQKLVLCFRAGDIDMVWYDNRICNVFSNKADLSYFDYSMGYDFVESLFSFRPYEDSRQTSTQLNTSQVLNPSCDCRLCYK